MGYANGATPTSLAVFSLCYIHVYLPLSGSLLLDGERWKQADVPSTIQALVHRLEAGMIVKSTKFSVSSPPLISRHQQYHPTAFLVSIGIPPMRGGRRENSPDCKLWSQTVHFLPLSVLFSLSICHFENCIQWCTLVSQLASI